MATESELQALVVRLEADTKNFRAEFLASQKAANEASTKIQTALEDIADSTRKSSLSISGVLQTALGVSLSGLLTGTFGAINDAAGALFNTFVTEGVSSAQEQQEAINNLNSALARSGQYSSEASNSFIELSAAMQANSKYGDEVILAAMSQIQTLGALDKDALKPATQAALDLSAALGVDLSTAATLVGKAAQGEIGTFKRYGVAIEEGSTKSETFANTLAAIQKQFGGAAAAQINTFAGSLTQTKNSFSDLQETTGGLIVENQAFIEVFKEASKILQEVNAGVGANNQSLKSLVAEGLIAAIDGAMMLTAGFDSVYRVGQVAFATLTIGLRQIVAGVVAAGEAIDGNFAGAWEALKAPIEDTKTAIKDAVTGDNAFDSIGESLARLKSAAETGFGAVRDGASSVVEPTNNAKAALAELSAEQTRMGEAGKKLAAELLEASPESVQKQQIEQLALQRELDLISLEEYHAAQSAALESQLANEQSLLDAAYAQKKLSESDYQAARSAEELKFTEARKKLGLQQLKDEQAQQKERAANLKSTFSYISSLQSSSSQELFRIGQASAIATATIDGFAAVQKALSSAPPPFNFALAALVGVATAANVGKIASASPPKFAEGGIVPGLAPVGDSVMVRANSGEVFMNRSQQQRLLDIADGRSGGGGGNSDALLGAILERLNRMELAVQISIGGKEIFDAVNEEIKSGRRLAYAT